MSFSYVWGMPERTTVRLERELLQQAKIYAARHNTSLTKVIEEALREKVAPKPASVPFELVTFGEGGLVADLDLSDNSAVQDFLDDLK